MSRSPLQHITEQLGHLINLSRIIDRNRDDSNFETRGGEILYVFDTNVLQMFFEPFKNPQYCEVFHKSYWGVDRENDLDVNSLACLLTGEYLLSGKLPGQRDRRWYMTRGHKAELDKQAAHLVARARENLQRIQKDAAFEDQVLKAAAKLIAALDIDPTGDRQHLETLVSQLSPGSASVRELKALKDREFRQRAVGIRAREVCRILARDEIAEPANQLYRYRSGAIAGRYMALEDFLRLSAAERRDVGDEVQAWRAPLGEVCDRRRSSKSRDAFQADCEALGLISWAARQPRFWRRRIVLVTGDAIVLETYRLRHLQEPHLRPYVVRPINHFAPLFNPVSAQSILPSQQYAFSKLQEVIEVVLVDLNLQLLLAADRETRQRARDAFVLEVEHNIEAAMQRIASAFPQADDRAWAEHQERVLGALVQELRPIERLMLEAFPNLVAPRLDIDRAVFEEAIGDRAESLRKAIERRLDAASVIGAQFSLQTMPDTLALLFTQFMENQHEHERRATIHVRLSFGAAEADLGYEAIVERLQSLPPADVRDELERLKGQPAKIFALAALFAFRLEIWKDAARYADLASRASQEQAASALGKPQPVQPEHYEYRYLLAASLRFRMAAQEPLQEYTYADPWADWLAVASGALEECIAFHESAGQLSRVMRARSEMAAVHLAYCEWFGFGELGKADEPDERAVDAFQVVADQLRACEDGLAAARARAEQMTGGTEGSAHRMLEAVCLQYRSNVHAAALTARRLRQLWPGQAARIVAIGALLPQPYFGDDWPDGPAVAQVYRAAVQGDRDRLAALRSKNFTLALDRAVVNGLIAMTETDQPRTGS